MNFKNVNFYLEFGPRHLFPINYLPANVDLIKDFQLQKYIFNLLLYHFNSAVIITKKYKILFFPRINRNLLGGNIYALFTR